MIQCGGANLFVDVHHLLPGGAGEPVRLGARAGLGAEIVLGGAARPARRPLLPLLRRLCRRRLRRLRLGRLLLRD